MYLLIEIENKIEKGSIEKKQRTRTQYVLASFYFAVLTRTSSGLNAAPSNCRIAYACPYILH